MSAASDFSPYENSVAVSWSKTCFEYIQEEMRYTEVLHFLASGKTDTAKRERKKDEKGEMKEK
jgi:hypothetical protein